MLKNFFEGIKKFFRGFVKNPLTINKEPLIKNEEDKWRILLLDKDEVLIKEDNGNIEIFSKRELTKEEIEELLRGR